MQGFRCRTFKLDIQSFQSCLCSSRTFDATLQFTTHIVSGNLPHIPDKLTCRLIPNNGTVGRVRPIAVGEVWLRIAALCSLEASTTTGQSLQPLNFGVGVPGGAKVVGHTIKAGHLAHPDQVTVLLDFRKTHCVKRQC